MELMSADVVLKAAGIETTEKAIDRVISKFVQLDPVVTKIEKVFDRLGKETVSSMSRTEAKAKSAGDATAKAAEETSRRQAAAERKAAQETKQAEREKEQARSREEKAAKLAEQAREREAAAAARRRKAEERAEKEREDARKREEASDNKRRKADQSESQAGKMRLGMVVGGIATGVQDAASVLAGGGSAGQAFAAGANNWIQAASLINPYYGTLLAAGVTVVQLGQAWYRITGNMEEAKKKAEEYRQAIAEGYAKAVAQSVFQPGIGKSGDFLSRLQQQKNDTESLTQQSRALEAEEKRLRQDKIGIDKRATAGNSMFQEADTIKALDESKTNAAQINAVVEERKKVWAELQAAQEKERRMSASAPAAKFELSQQNKVAAAGEAANLLAQGGQAVVDRKLALDKELSGLQSQIKVARTELQNASTAAQKSGLQQMIDKLQQDYDALNALKQAIGKVVAEAHDKIAEDKVFANKNAASQFLKDIDIDEATRTESKRISELKTVKEVEADIARNRATLLKESESPDFKAERQRQLQSLIGAGMSRREALLDRVRPPVDTAEQLRLQENSRAGRKFSSDLAMVDDIAALKDVLHDVNRRIEEESKSPGFTAERQAELLGEKQQIEDRIEELNRQKQMEEIEKKVADARKGATMSRLGFGDVSTHVMQALNTFNADKAAKDALAEAKRQSGFLKDLVNEVKTKRTSAIAIAG